MTPKSDFIRIAQARGYVHQFTDIATLDARMAAGPVAGYIGFDATADSLHVGSLVQIMLLRLLQRTGHRPVVLMGGGTTKVGDPSGRDEGRQLLTDAQIESNKAGIRRVFDSFLAFGGGPTDAVMLDNAAWLDELRYIPFLRDIGRHFSVNRMLGMDSVKLRLDREQPLSFLEFNYMLLQSYDFLELNRRHGVALQMGGSDQWGNIVMGAELVRRVTAEQHGGNNAAEAFGMTTPLLTTASGAKMGKTAAGAVWLNADRLSAYDYWQFWRNTEDADIGRFLGLFTELPLNEVTRLGALGGAEINEAKKVLATEATALLHGREAAELAGETARRAFEEGANAASLPTIIADLNAGVAILQLAQLTGFTKSNGEGRRAVANGSLYLNSVVVSDAARVVTVADLQGGVLRLSFGKKQHVLVRAG